MLIELEKTAKILNEGGIAAIPTETVYGLAAKMSSEDSVKKIFSLKGRPQENPLIVHAGTVEQIKDLVNTLPEKFDILAEKFWPGPLTLVLPANETFVPSIVRAGLPTVAVRIPNHPLALRLLDITGPLVAPSANLSGRPSSTKPAHIEEDFGPSFPVLDGGPCQNGVESTIIIYSDAGWKLGRLGSIPLEEIESILGEEIAIESSSTPLCPGQLYRHYSPRTKLTTGPYLEQPIVIGFEGREYPGAQTLILLGSLEQPDIIAANLYSSLRSLDEQNIQEAWIDLDFEDSGLLKTIKERLIKASQK